MHSEDKLAKNYISMLAKNLAINLANRIIGISITYALVPFYVGSMGQNEYGLIAYYNFIASIATLIDLGIPLTVVREISGQNASKTSPSKLGNLLKTGETVYFGLTILMLLFYEIMVNPVLLEKIKTTHINNTSAHLFVVLIGYSIPAQLIFQFYSNLTVAIGKNFESSCVQILWSMSKALGTVYWVSTTQNKLAAFATWQLVCNLMFALFSREYLHRNFITPKSEKKFRWSIIKKFRVYSLEAAANSTISMALLHADKLIVGTMLSVNDFGLYSMASTLGTVSTIISATISQVTLPSIVANRMYKDKKFNSNQHIWLSKSVMYITVPLAVMISINAKDLIHFWTKNLEIASYLAWPTALLTVGNVAQALMVISNNEIIAAKDTKTGRKFGIFSIVFYMPTAVFLTIEKGLTGVALSWLLLNFILLPLFLNCVNRKTKSAENLKWFWKELVLVVFLSVCVAIAVKIASYQVTSRYVKILCWIFAAVFPTLALFVKNREERLAFLGSPKF